MMVKPYKIPLTISKPERHTTTVRYGLLEGLARRSARCWFLQCDWPRRSSHRLARDYPLTSGLVATPVPILSPAHRHSRPHPLPCLSPLPSPSSPLALIWSPSTPVATRVVDLPSPSIPVNDGMVSWGDGEESSTDPSSAGSDVSGFGVMG